MATSFFLELGESHFFHVPKGIVTFQVEHAVKELFPTDLVFDLFVYPCCCHIHMIYARMLPYLAISFRIRGCFKSIDSVQNSIVLSDGNILELIFAQLF